MLGIHHDNDIDMNLEGEVSGSGDRVLMNSTTRQIHPSLQCSFRSSDPPNVWTRIANATTLATGLADQERSIRVS